MYSLFHLCISTTVGVFSTHILHRFLQHSKKCLIGLHNSHITVKDLTVPQIQCFTLRIGTEIAHCVCREGLKFAPFQTPMGFFIMASDLSAFMPFATQQVKPKVVTAVEWLDKAILQLREPTSSGLYGNCYVMAREKKKGILWQSLTKELAAAALSQHSAMGVKQLFQKVRICFLSML